MTNEPDNRLSDREVSILLAEYHAVQASAQHHDSLIWTATGIIWAASLVLLGIVVGNVGDARTRLPLAGVAVIAVLLHVFLMIVQTELRAIKRQKYERSKWIETKLSMRQDSSVCHDEGSQTQWYRIIQILFIVAWLGAVIVLLTAAAS